MSNTSSAPPSAATNRRLEIAAYIRAQIFSGHLRPGEKIDQDTVAAANASSRIPVREALIALEREGLITWSHFRGAYVADLTEADVRDHFALLGATAALVVRQIEHSDAEQRQLAVRAAERLFASRNQATSQRRLAELCDALVAAGLSHRLALEFESLTASLPLWRFAEGRPQRPTVSQNAFEAEAAAVRYYDKLGELIVLRLENSGFWKDRARPAAR